MTPTGSRARRASRDPQDLYEAQLELFLDPNDPAIAAQARADGVPDAWIEAAKRSPTYKMAVDWRIAFPLHPEYRTLPMVWYVPPLSPIQSHANAGAIETRRRDPRRALVAHSGPLSRQSADRRRRGADRHGARAHAGDARLLSASASSARATDEAVLEQAGLTRRAGRGDAPLSLDRQLRGPLRHPDQPSRAGGGRLWAARLLRLHLRQRLRLRAAALERCSAARWAGAS